MKTLFLLVLMVPGLITARGQDVDQALLKAEAFIRRGLPARAITACSEIAEGSDDYRIFLKRGDAYLQAGDPESARRDFIHAGEIKISAGYLGLARVEAYRGNAVESVEYLRKHLGSEFKVTEKELMLDRYFSGIEDSPEWRGLWRTNWYNELEQAVSEIEYLVRESRMDEASSKFSDVREMYSDKPETSYLEGLMKLAGGNNGMAAKLLGNAINGGYSSFNAVVNYIIAMQANGDWAASGSFVSDALKQFPDRPELFLYQAEAMRKTGEREKGLQLLDQYLELFPDDGEAIAKAGRIALEEKQYSRSLKYYSVNITNDPGNAGNWVLRGDAYLASKTWEFAISDYSMALDIDPFNSAAYYNKGQALLKTGKTEDACHDLKKALSLGNKLASDLVGRYCIR